MDCSGFFKQDPTLQSKAHNMADMHQLPAWALFSFPAVSVAFTKSLISNISKTVPKVVKILELRRAVLFIPKVISDFGNES